MKNIFKLLFIPFLCSCEFNINRIPLKSGTYESVEIVSKNNDFTKAKYILNEINEQEYLEASSINVIKDGGTYGKKQKFYSFELYFFLESLNNFIKLETINFDYKQDSSAVYTATFTYDSNETHISRLLIFDYQLNAMHWFEEYESSEIKVQFVLKK